MSIVLSIFIVSSFLLLSCVTLHGYVIILGCFQLLVFGNKAALPRNVKVFGPKVFCSFVCLLFVSHGSVARIGTTLSYVGISKLDILGNDQIAFQRVVSSSCLHYVRIPVPLRPCQPFAWSIFNILGNLMQL